MENFDADLVNADWTKRSWDLPPYKSSEFNSLVHDLPAFRNLPVYAAAVEVGLIVNDEWKGPVASPGKKFMSLLLGDGFEKAYNPDQPRDERGRWGSGSTAGDVPSPAAQAETVAEIKNFLGIIDHLQPNSEAGLLLKEGQAFTATAESFTGKRDKPQQCYKNAALAALSNPRLTYVEGYIAVHGVPLAHAWTVDEKGAVRDSTIRPVKGLAYFGIPLSTEYLEQRLVAQKVYGVLQHHSNPELYSKSLPPGARATVRTLGKYNPDQERDEHGRWTSGGGGLPPISNPAERGVAVNDVCNSAVNAGKDTETLHDKIDGQAGRYSAAREIQHAEIVKDALDKAIAAGAGKDDRAIIMGGIYGAGKTSALRALVDSSKFVTISPDNMKEALAARGMIDPPPGVHPMEAAALMHEESSKLAWDLAEKATSQGYNVIWDTSMGSSGAIDKRISAMKELHPDYKTTGVFIDVPIAQAQASAEKRYANGLARNPETARYTPPQLIAATADPKHGTINRGAFEQSKGKFDNWMLVDNTNYASKVAAVSHENLLTSDGRLRHP